MSLQVHFLGTGGGTPSRRRFLSATAVRREGQWFLFDAGEGAQIRLQQSPLGWGGLRAVFISHVHGDHLLGLPGLLMSMGMARMDRPLGIYGPPGLESMLQTVLRFCQVELSFPLEVLTIPRDGGTLLNEREYSIEAFRLRHRVPCFGFALREKDRTGRFDIERAAAAGVPAGPLYGVLQRGEAVLLPDGSTVPPSAVLGPARPGRVVAYCTDTAPCAETVRGARNADLLIHDATFGDGFEAEAELSRHSTARQAAEMARSAGAKRLVLTHISPRYDDAAELLSAAREVFSETILAEDGLIVDLPLEDE